MNMGGTSKHHPKSQSEMEIWEHAELSSIRGRAEATGQGAGVSTDRSQQDREMAAVASAWSSQTSRHRQWLEDSFFF